MSLAREGFGRVENHDYIKNRPERWAPDLNPATMTSNTSDSQLDEYLDGIRRKFDHLNQELDEARHQRDEYKRNCIVCSGHLIRSNASGTQTRIKRKSYRISDKLLAKATWSASSAEPATITFLLL